MTLSMPTRPDTNGREPAMVPTHRAAPADAPPTVHESDTRRGPRQRTLPPIAAMLARPLLLAVCVLIGAGAGFFATGSTGFRSSAAVEFTVDTNDVALVRLQGQTLANRAMSNEVIQRAAVAIGEPADELAASTTADWRVDAMLVDVTATGPSSDVAAARANAVATVTVDVLREAVNNRLGATTSQASALLGAGVLPDPDAEAARRAQVGSSLAERQGALTAQSDSVFVAVPASEAVHAGTPKALGLAIGLAAGLFGGCVIAVLLGGRGLRVRSLGTLRRLAPAADVLSPSEAPQLVGQLVQKDTTYVAIVATRGSLDAADEFASDLTRLLDNHGKSATTIHPPATLDGDSAKLLRADVPKRVAELVGTDVLIVVVQSGTESASMLEGRSGLRTVVVMRRHRTPVADGLSATVAYQESSPVLVLAK